MFGFLTPIIAKIVPWKGLIMAGLAVLVLVGGWLYIGKITAERDEAIIAKELVKQQLDRVVQINADNAKAFADYRAVMDRAFLQVKEATDAERRRNEDLSQFIEDLQNVQDTDACFKSEPIRRALDWLRGKAGAPPPN